MSMELNLPEGKLPYPVRPGDAPFKSLERWLDVDRAPVIMEAKREIRAQAVQKLELLDDMHRDLIRRAQAILEKAQEDLRLHDVPMYAAKVRARVYYLYCYPHRQDSDFFSILEPEEYLVADPLAHCKGTYRLNEDSSWTRLDPESK